jgi:hypothetical protein
MLDTHTPSSVSSSSVAAAVSGVDGTAASTTAAAAAAAAATARLKKVSMTTAPVYVWIGHHVGRFAGVLLRHHDKARFLVHDALRRLGRPLLRPLVVGGATFLCASSCDVHLCSPLCSLC